jgi:hypothetical protein
VIDYCRKKLLFLKACNVTPILIFGGNRLKMTAITDDERAKKRAEAREQAEACFDNCNPLRALDWLGMTVEITPEMAHKLAMVA